MPGGYVGARPKDETKLLSKPSQVRIRLRRAAKGGPLKLEQMKRDVAVLYQKPIEEWDLDELAHGRPRDASGGFRGVKPTWISPLIVREAKRRLMEHCFGELAGHVDQAVKTLVELMQSDEVDDKGRPIVDARTKLAASTFIIEHVIGKPKNSMELEVKDMTRAALASAIVLDDGKPQDYIEGEVVEDDDE